MSPDSPDLAQAKRLLDALKRAGFRFQRAAPDADAPLIGQRSSGPWIDIIAIDGFSRDCAAWRHRKSLLIVPGTGGMDRRITGSALTVLGEVLTWETEP